MERTFLAIALALLPIYSFASGGIQPSHAALAGVVAIRLAKSKLSLRTEEFLLLTLALVIAVREGYAVMFDAGPATSLLEILYLMFALLVVVGFGRMPITDTKFSKVITWGLAASGVLALIGIMYYGTSWNVSQGSVVRSVGTFNNPNQLAYFAVCLISLASLLYLRRYLDRWSYLAAIVLSSYLAAASLSKAGLVAMMAATTLSIATISGGRRISPRAIAACVIFSGLILALYWAGVLDQLRFVQRIEMIGSDADDSLGSRGYLLPFQAEGLGFVFGIGQQDVLLRHGHEVHSTFWSFFAKYGLVGFGLFMAFWFRWSKSLFDELGMPGVLLIVLPPTLYGITHNGARFAILWVLIGLTFAWRKHDSSARSDARNAAARDGPTGQSSAAATITKPFPTSGRP